MEDLFPPLHLQGRGTTRRVVEGTFTKESPSTALRAVPLPRKTGGGKER